MRVRARSRARAHTHNYSHSRARRHTVIPLLPIPTHHAHLLPAHTADATYQIADVNGATFTDDNPKRCPTDWVDPTDPEVGLPKPTTAALTEDDLAIEYETTNPIWGFKVKPAVACPELLLHSTSVRTPNADVPPQACLPVSLCRSHSGPRMPRERTGLPFLPGLRSSCGSTPLVSKSHASVRMAWMGQQSSNFPNTRPASGWSLCCALGTSEACTTPVSVAYSLFQKMPTYACSTCHAWSPATGGDGYDDTAVSSAGLDCTTTAGTCTLMFGSIDPESGLTAPDFTADPTVLSQWKAEVYTVGLNGVLSDKTSSDPVDNA